MLRGLQSDFSFVPPACGRCERWPKCDSQRTDSICQDLWSQLEERHAGEGSFVNRVEWKTKRDTKVYDQGSLTHNPTDFITTKLYKTRSHQSSRCTDKTLERTEVEFKRLILSSVLFHLPVKGRGGRTETELSCRPEAASGKRLETESARLMGRQAGNSF